MANLNKVLLIGNLTRDPELRHTPSGMAVAEFGLATNRRYKGGDGQQQEETTFIDITTWGRQAELASQYLHKGRAVFIEGRLKLDQWTAQDGGKRSKLSVTAENLQFLDSRGQGQGGPQGGGGYGRQGGDFGGQPPGGQAPGGGDRDFGGQGAQAGGYHDAGMGGSSPPASSDDDIPF